MATGVCTTTANTNTPTFIVSWNTTYLETFGAPAKKQRDPVPAMDTEEKIAMLDEMIEIVEGRVQGKAWVKGVGLVRGVDAFDRPLDGMCLGGIIHWLQTRELTDVMPDVMHPVMAEIGQVILEQYANRVNAGEFILSGSVVVPFNDHPETTQAEVVQVLEKARMAVAERV